MKPAGLLFDPEDHLLVKTVNAFDGGDDKWNIREFASELHPRGILELMEPRSLRIVKTVMILLDDFISGSGAVSKRINAMTLLRDELCEGFNVPLKYNTARVVLELAKELIRVREDRIRALRAAHDMRIALLGKPRFIREQLLRLQLVEMPEQHLQVSFDYHVHDANTKGRKTPSHLIMDAWIKGIRTIQVIYYDQVPQDAAFELMRAAEIMGIDVRIGIEFRALHRDRFIELIWTPRGFAGADDFLKFLNRHKNADFHSRCEEAAVYRTASVFGVLRRFNVDGRMKMNAAYHVEMAELSDREFSSFISRGKRPTIEHVSEFIEQQLRTLLERELVVLEEQTTSGSREEERCAEIHTMLADLNGSVIKERFLDFSHWEKVPESVSDLPSLMQQSPRELLAELRKQGSGFRATLNLTGLELADVIEILYDCKGEITALEIFNLKDHIAELPRRDRDFNELRHALNSGNVIKLKNLVLKAVDEVKSGNSSHRAAIIDRLRTVLRNLTKFTGFYARAPLKCAIGSDSTGKAALARGGMGMGFAVVDTLDRRVQRHYNNGDKMMRLPLHCEVFRQISFLPARWYARKSEKVEWVCSDLAYDIGGTGNVIPLGYRPFRAESSASVRGIREFYHYMNSNIKIGLNILLGFTAAFLTFFFSGSWWVLAWMGAPIWLGITLLRNVVQFRIASGAFRTSPLFKWNEFISWQRIGDSLFFTGLSVPLLDLVVKNIIMRQCFGVTTENNPMVLYCVMGLANGLYITCHNLLRALPAQAVAGNWLRVPLAIPIAFTINALLASVLHAAGMGGGAEVMLQQWAAVISKFSSDCVAGVVEALADRGVYIRARAGDLKRKLADFYRLASALELIVPERELLREKRIFANDDLQNSVLLNKFYVNALDLMYIWMRQPRAPQVISRVIRSASLDERRIFVGVQHLLEREHDIGKLLRDDALGENSSRVLNFYLGAYKLYLSEISALEK